MEKDESLYLNTRKIHKKITFDPKKELFIKKKDIYLLNLLGKRNFQSIPRETPLIQKSYSVKESSDLPKKTKLILKQIPKISQKENKKDFEPNKSLIIINNPLIKEYNLIRENNYTFKSSFIKYKDKSLQTTNISDINCENTKILNEDNQNESKKSIENKNKNNSLNRISLNNVKKTRNDFKFDRYFIEFIQDKNIFITPNKPKKLFKRISNNFYNTNKNNISNNSIKNISSNNKPNPSNIIKDFKIENPLIVIPCKKSSDHMKIFNDIIFNEFESKKQTTISKHRSFKTKNIFEGNFNNNYLDLYQKVYNSNNHKSVNKIDYNNIYTITNGLNYLSLYKGKPNNEKKLFDKHNKINFSLKGIPNVVKRFYGI